MKSKLDLARREMRGAVINLDVPDDKLLELRADTRRLFEEVKELERKAAKKGLFGILGF
jgi:predicted ribonuclease toxin of YeeF-YezG toxin-antitoxin module